MHSGLDILYIQYVASQMKPYGSRCPSSHVEVTPLAEVVRLMDLS